jgi:hypothetical protein
MQQPPHSKSKNTPTRATNQSAPKKYGDVFAIQLENNTYGYGQLLASYTIRCFNLETKTLETRLDTITSADTAFVMGVFKFALAGWLSDCTIIDIDGTERPATIDECIEANLEREGAWDAPHVEDRLLAFLRGKVWSHAEHAKLIVPKDRS